jgi:hypothetical protein
VSHCIICSRRIDWKAYPRFQPPEVFSDFTLAPRLYYVNALENALSCAESAAVAAKIVANLIISVADASQQRA